MKFGSITTPIVTDGLVFNVDPANRASYVDGDTETLNTINSTQSGSISGATFVDTSGPTWNFDGTDDYIEIGATGQGPLYDIGTGDFTVNMWCAKDTTSTYAWFISNFDSAVGGFAMGTWNDNTSLHWRIYPGVWI